MSQLPPTEKVGKPAAVVVEDNATRGRRYWVTFGTATQLDLGFILFAAFVYPILFAVAYLGDLSPVLGVVLNGALLVVAATLPMAMLDLPKAESEEGPSLDFAMLSVGSIVIIISFGQLCRHLQSLVGGFAASHSSYWYWNRFGFAEFINAVLFDAPSIYGVKVSDISSISPLARTLQFAFHLCLLTVVVVAVGRHTGRVRKHWRAQGLASDLVRGKMGMFLLKTTTTIVFWWLTVGIVGVGYARELVPGRSFLDAAAPLLVLTAGIVLAIGSVGVWLGKHFYESIGLLVVLLEGKVKREDRPEIFEMGWHTLLAGGGLWFGLFTAHYGLRWFVHILHSS